MARIQAVNLKTPLLARWGSSSLQTPDGMEGVEKLTAQKCQDSKWWCFLGYIISAFSEIPPGGKCNRLEQFKFTPHSLSTGLGIGKLPRGCQLQMVGLPGPGSLKQIDYFWADPEFQTLYDKITLLPPMFKIKIKQNLPINHLAKPKISPSPPCIFKTLNILKQFNGMVS